LNRLLLSLCAIVTGCAAEPGLDLEARAATGEIAYYRLESQSGGKTTVSRVNGGVFACPGTSPSKRCTVDALVLPADCGWECQDGLLSGRGVAVFAGTIDRVAGQRRLLVEAGWDTWRAGPGPFQFYRLAPLSSVCAAAPCPGELRAKRLNGQEKAKKVVDIDFSGADDANYVLDPTRGFAQAASTAGLLASGVMRNGVFEADRVFRLWTPRPACDPQRAARAHWFHGGEDVLDIELRTVSEAESYVDPMGRSVHWLVRDGEDELAVEFTAGTNDLWAQRIGIDKASCEITILGEH
jgi:hypothetical protein